MMRVQIQVQTHTHTQEKKIDSRSREEFKKRGKKKGNEYTQICFSSTPFLNIYFDGGTKIKHYLTREFQRSFNRMFFSDVRSDMKQKNEKKRDTEKKIFFRETLNAQSRE